MGRISFFCMVGILLFAEPIKPIPEHMEVNNAKAALGKKLFFDTSLSKNNTISCASCHNLADGGDDGLKYSFGMDGTEGDINAPTVYNAVFNFRQFWDGRAKDLEEQATFPVGNPKEMSFTMDALVDRLKKNADYVHLFSKVYPDGITKKNIPNAIAEYEKTLITPNAPFDKFLKGDKNAISQEAKEGYRLFKAKGCVICHNGINIGGNLYNRFGVYDDANSTNLGRYNITQREEDKFIFKVPSLRNVALTAPYMHDGRFDNLTDAVKFMSYYQLGRFIEEKEIKAIVAFLNTLNGEIPQSAKRNP